MADLKEVSTGDFQLIYCSIREFQSFFFATFNGGEEHLPQMPDPRIGIFLIIMSKISNIVWIFR